MSLSVIAANQREKEEEELRSFLTYSLLGSVAFHVLVLFFGTMLWDRQPALAENPIEVIMVDAPAEETLPPAPKVSPSPPAPFVLDPSGRPMNMQLAESSGNSDLDSGAIEAVRKMRFASPGNRPLGVRMGITFTLGG